jgi:hypothetical protein
MSRAGYSDDYEYAALWTGAVQSAIRGKRGQAFLQELLAALDALPKPRLVANELEEDGEVCALGSVGVRRGLNIATMDPYDWESLSKTFNIAEALVREIEYENDERWRETPEERFIRVRAWVVAQLPSDNPGARQE